MTTLMECPSSRATTVIDTLLSGTTDYRIIGNGLVLSRQGYYGLLAYKAVR